MGSANDARPPCAPIRQPRGRPRRRPKKLHADKAYDPGFMEWTPPSRAAS